MAVKARVQPDRDVSFERRTLTELGYASYVALLDQVDEFDDFTDVLLLPEFDMESD
jgi:hypothetical protein